MSETIDRIINNAKIAAPIWDKFINQKENKNFKAYFHLRPTSIGITIVSTSPYAPMRGIKVSAAELEYTLSEIKKSYNSLVSADETTAKNRFAELGFKARTSDIMREENVQARMIRGMVRNRPQYENIRFVASELTIMQKHRLDVVGIRDEVLYIFEMKNIRSTKAPDQADRYLEHISQRDNDFKTLLNVYPGGPFDYKGVEGISVEPFAENTSLRERTNLWLFEDGLDFYK